MKFMTIRQLHKERPDLPEYRLRCWCREGKLPGFWSGSRYLIDVDRLNGMLEKLCSVNK